MNKKFRDLASRLIIYGSSLNPVNTLLVLASSYFLLSYLFISWHHLNFPYELEWIESGYPILLSRILSGEGIYVAPSMNYVPFVYTPLFPYLAAFFAIFTGASITPLRIVSFLSTCISIALIFNIIYVQTKNNLAAFVAIGLFTASFPLSGGWFNVGRPDSLFLMLMLASFFSAIKYSGVKQTLLVSIFLILAFFTKQSALLLILFFSIYLVVKNNKSYFLFFVLIIGLSLVVSVSLFDSFSDGWFNFFVFETVGNHSLTTSRIWEKSVDYFREDLITPYLFAVIIGLFYFLRKRTLGNFLADPVLSNFLFITGLISISWASRLNYGGFLNVLMPAFAGISILFGLGLSMLSNSLADLQKEKEPRLGHVGLGIVAIVQFALLLYPLTDHIPTKDDYDSGENIARIVSKVEGPVLIPFHNYYGMLVGKESFLNWTTYMEFNGNYSAGGGNQEQLQLLKNEIESALDSEYFGAVIMDVERITVPENHYQLIDMKKCSLIIEPDLYGWQIEPSLLYLSTSNIESLDQICPGGE